MAQNDMHVVMYKVLAYLYSCMKDGKQAQTSVIAHSEGMFELPYQYWAQIIKQLVDNNYLEGISIQKAWGGDLIVNMSQPTVTLCGVEFMQENSMMKKALEFLKEIKSTLPFI